VLGVGEFVAVPKQKCSLLERPALRMVLESWQAGGGVHGTASAKTCVWFHRRVWIAAAPGIVMCRQCSSSSTAVFAVEGSMCVSESVFTLENGIADCLTEGRRSAAPSCAELTFRRQHVLVAIERGKGGGQGCVGGWAYIVPEDVASSVLADTACACRHRGPASHGFPFPRGLPPPVTRRAHTLWGCVLPRVSQAVIKMCCMCA
jgi:hypothetical protein